jgi:hypothetical protein
MNGIGLSRPDADDLSKVNEFATRLKDFAASSEHLSRWAESIVAENLNVLELREPRLAEYLNLAAEHHFDREEAFNKMYHFFANEQQGRR